MSSQSQVNVGTSARLHSQDDVSQHQGETPLSLPQLNHLFEVFFVWDENSTCNCWRFISSLHKLTQQILRHWQSFLDLKLMFTTHSTCLIGGNQTVQDYQDSCTCSVKWLPTQSTPDRLSVSLSSLIQLTMTIRSRHKPTTLNYRYSLSLTNDPCGSRVSRYRGKGRNQEE